MGKFILGRCGFQDRRPECFREPLCHLHGETIATRKETTHSIIKPDRLHLNKVKGTNFFSVPESFLRNQFGE